MLKEFVDNEKTLTPAGSGAVAGSAHFCRSTGRGGNALAIPVAVTIIIVAASAILLFTRLGHYALWDDEALTVMTARNVWHTGDTSAWIDGHNLLAYRHGLLINHFKDRYTPPLQFYVIAPFVGLLGDSNFISRLPSAICGVITVLILLRWMWRHRPGALVWWSAAFILLTNASFFLFFRQARYYALATMLSTAVAYQYWHLGNLRRSVVGLALLLTALLTAQYMDYAAVLCCLVVDYLVWGRKQRKLDWRDFVILALPQILVGAVVLSIWNPVARGVASLPVGKFAPTLDHPWQSWLIGKAHLYWWNWRDMIACDFLVVPLLLACPLLYFFRRNNALLRAPLALAVFLFGITLTAATEISLANNAEVRYLAPLLPLCVGIGILAVWGMEHLKPKIIATFLLIAGLSTVIEPNPDGDRPQFGSTALLYYRELIYPQAEPYTPTEAWVNEHVPAGASIAVQPDWMQYPLMLRCPGPIYAWQLVEPVKAEYVGLPDIFFSGKIPPDYLIAFGPYAHEIDQMRAQLAGRANYQLIEALHYHWKDLYRPERIWRSFSTMPPSPGLEIYIYRRDDAPYAG